jgi:hypothetical protein
MRRGAVYISGLEYRPPHQSQVPQLMRDLVGWIATEGAELPTSRVRGADPRDVSGLSPPPRWQRAHCAFDVDYLGWLLREGRITGQKRCERWYTSEAAVRRYQQEVTERAVPIGRPRWRSASNP